MGIRWLSMISQVKQILKQQSGVPRGHVAVYVGDIEKKKRFVVPISYLNHPSFQDCFGRPLLSSPLNWVSPNR